MRLNKIRKFLKLEAASGMILFSAAFLAILFNNSFLSHFYESFFYTPLRISFANFSFSNPLLFWINEGLMAVFFLLVGLELKREILEGELSTINQIILPGMAAVGGMLVPAFIYYIINFAHPVALQGWAIPVATDITFALAILSLFGRKVPIGLKIFLMALAIFDDVGAIIIIALSHTNKLSFLSLLFSVIMLCFLGGLNKAGIKRLTPYLLLGMLLWMGVLQSGIHATLAGVLLAFFIPMHKNHPKSSSPLFYLETKLHPWVVYFILPLFAFANAGITLNDLTVDLITSTTVLGIVAGLFLGKQIGVFSVTFALIKLGWAKKPLHTGWLELYGVSVLCGIGFTMSIFLGTLAFQSVQPAYLVEARLGVLIGSTLSGMLGALLLYIAFKKKKRRSCN